LPVKAPADAVRNHRVEFQAHYAHCRLWIAVWHRFLTGRRGLVRASWRDRRSCAEVR
jgi:hypothetical protein